MVQSSQSSYSSCIWSNPAKILQVRHFCRKHWLLETWDWSWARLSNAQPNLDARWTETNHACFAEQVRIQSQEWKTESPTRCTRVSSDWRNRLHGNLRSGRISFYCTHNICDGSSAWPGAWANGCRYCLPERTSERRHFFGCPRRISEQWQLEQSLPTPQNTIWIETSSSTMDAKMHKFLVHDLGTTSSHNDPCLYIRHTSSGILLIGLYVDDLLIAGSRSQEISDIKKELSKRFEMKDWGEARVMLGIEIQRDQSARKLFINQRLYAETVLERFGMANSKPVATPMEKFQKPLPSDLSSPASNVPYRQAVGSLMYLMIGTRPDIAYAIGKLSQFSAQPLQHH